MTTLDTLLKAPGAGLEAEDDFEAINELFRGKGWSDGLPIIPPTAQRVQEMLAYCDRPLDEPIGLMAPRYGAATPVTLAANAVMAGCRPEYFPVLMAAVEAACDDKFNLYGVQATTHQCAVMILVNGPIARELKINCGHNAFGPGWQANATIGRAMRLAQVNIGGAIPTTGDMSTFGSPGKYTYCAAENEADSPWEPLHVELGFAKETSTVTVYSAEGPHNVNDHESITGEGLLKMIAGTVAMTGSNNVYYEGAPLVICGPEHAQTIAQDGYSKADVKRYLYEHARVPLASFSNENIERRMRQWAVYKGEFAKAGMEARVPVIKRPDGVHIVVIGGAGKHSAFVPTFGASEPVTRAIRRRDGTPVRSIGELRK
jgi:hypothetical protein